MEIRFARDEDIPEMLKILTYYINNTAVLFADTVPEKEDYVKEIKGIMEEYPVIVAVSDNHIIGYAYASKFHEGEAYRHNVQTTIYIRKEYHRKKAGQRLYEKLEQTLVKQNVITLYAYIAATDTPDEYLTDTSINFHNRMGYKKTGSFKHLGYKFGRWYDAVWMVKQISQINNPPGDFIKFSDL